MNTDNGVDVEEFFAGLAASSDPSAVALSTSVLLEHPRSDEWRIGPSGVDWDAPLPSLHRVVPVAALVRVARWWEVSVRRPINRGEWTITRDSFGSYVVERCRFDRPHPGERTRLLG